MENCKKSRASNWDRVEKELLREIVKQYISIVENKKTDTNTNSAKKQAWLKILNRFNEMSSNVRGLQNIQQQWRSMKLDAKKGISIHRHALKKTGGGEKPPSPKPEHLDMLDILPAEFEEDFNIFDSDGVYNQGSAVRKLSQHHPAADVDSCSMITGVSPSTMQGSAVRKLSQHHPAADVDSCSMITGVSPSTMHGSAVRKLSLHQPAADVDSCSMITGVSPSTMLPEASRFKCRSPPPPLHESSSAQSTGDVEETPHLSKGSSRLHLRKKRKMTPEEQYPQEILKLSRLHKINIENIYKQKIELEMRLLREAHENDERRKAEIHALKMEILKKELLNK